MANKITIGCPIENRRYCLEEYWNGLINLKMPEGYEPRYRFVMREDKINAQDDGTSYFLKRQREVGQFDTAICYIKHPSCHRQRPEYSYEYLAMARNAMLKSAFYFNETDWLLMIDSDIVLEPDGLLKLFGSGFDIRTVRTALIRNSKNPEVFNVLNKESDRGIYSRRDVKIHPPESLLCDLSGACSLIPRSIYKAGVRYYGDDTSNPRIPEDEGFARAMGEKGFLVNTDIKTLHYMEEDKPPLVYDPTEPTRTTRVLGD